MHLEFKADTNEIQKMFHKLSQLGKTDDLTRKIANVLWEEAEDAFDNERSPEGEKWATLKEPYKSQRYKKRLHWHHVASHRRFNGKPQY